MNTPFPTVVARPAKARLTVEDFLLLADHGAFSAYTRTELLDGEVWFVNALHSRHGRMVAELTTDLNIALRAMGAEQRPFIAASTRLDDHSLPEPDIVVSDYKGPHIVPLETVGLLIEVSDSTLDIDLGHKLRIYARAGIAEYWVVDLQAGKLHQLWSPEGERYRERREIALGDRVEAATIAGLSVPTTAG